MSLRSELATEWREAGRITQAALSSALALTIGFVGFAGKVLYDSYQPPGVAAVAPRGPDPEPTPRGMEPCYDSPIQPSLLDGLETTSPSPLTLEQDKNRRVTGDPGTLKPDIRAKIAGATVKINNVLPAGTGFLLQPDLVVAAAHSVATADFETIDVMDSSGNIGKVIDGCYIYEKAGRLADPYEHDGAGVDVAVLRLARPLGTATLSLSNTQLSQGDWATFFNYQGHRTMGSPAEYNGVVLADRPNITGNIVLTGLQSWRGCEPPKNQSSDCSIEPGASGGPVVHWGTGEVIGISVRGTAEGRLSEQDMLTYGAAPNFATGTGTGYQPRIALTSNVQAIRAAVSALQ